jgi:multidrug transporter EmrE-like cation transporter
MGVVLRVLPAVFLVAYSQVVVKWRIEQLGAPPGSHLAGGLRYVAYLLDPFILSAYVAGFASSFVWLFAITKLPLAQAFPIYQGLTFVAVIASSALLLGEPMSTPKLLGAALIVTGVTIGAHG